MGIFKLRGYEGSAEILGVMREIKFTDGALIIDELSLAECNQIVGYLATGTLHGIQPGDTESSATREILQSADEPCDTPNDAPPPAETKPAKKDENPLKEKKPAAKAEENAEPPKEDKPRRRRGRPRKSEAAANKPPADDKSNGKSNGKSETKPAKADASDELVAKLQGEKRLRDVLGVMVENGIKTRAELLAKCLELKSSVPVLERSPEADLEGRIARISGSFGVTE
jgi:hypothetical protein